MGEGSKISCEAEDNGSTSKRRNEEQKMFICIVKLFDKENLKGRMNPIKIVSWIQKKDGNVEHGRKMKAIFKS